MHLLLHNVPPRLPMMTRPQFTIRAICLVVLCSSVSLALIRAGFFAEFTPATPLLRLSGVALAGATVGGAFGYAMRRNLDVILIGAAIGSVCALLLPPLVIALTPA